MGKKGTWFSAIKRIFTSNRKHTEAEKKKNKARGRSFIPLFKEPSSIEKILGEVDQHNLFSQPQPSFSLHQHHTVTPEPTPQHHVSATRIQAAYRGYMARKSSEGSTGLGRLQGLVRGHNVKQQTVNAMKQMQLLVRVQTQIQSRRIQTLENQANKNDGKAQPEMGDEDWDDSLITKEEREARLQKKVEAVVKRERAMAYAYSHQLWKASPKSALVDIRSGGYPWWWNWLERQLPCDTRSSRPTRSNNTPMSRSMVPPRSRKSKARGSLSPYPMKDDDSLMSCPPFSVPNYMSPTVSAKAKARPTSNPRDRLPSSPGSEASNRRFSFPQTPNVNRWNKGTPGSGGDMSMDSAISMPATVGRKPFNRFV